MGDWRFSSALTCAIHCALLLTSGGLAQAQDETEEEPYLPGLIAQYDYANSVSIQRLESVVYVPRPDRPSEAFGITYRGVLLVPDDGVYQLHVHGAGDVQVELDGKRLIGNTKFSGWITSPETRLTFGPLPLEIKFAIRDWPVQLSFFWSSDRFEREPVPPRALAHDRKQVISTDFEQGRVLARALRCEACHGKQEKSTSVAAPALDHLAGSLHRDWMVDWLQATKTSPDRRMPALALPAAEAELLAAWLLAPHEPDNKPAKLEPKPRKETAEKKEPKAAPSPAAGEQLLLTRGCLACHRLDDLGETGLYGGGDLSQIATKRPANFFAKWLLNPEELNFDHRMPVFELTAAERASLSMALEARGKRRDAPGEGKGAAVDGERARALAKKHRCDQCHRMPEGKVVGQLAAPPPPNPLTKASNWQRSCGIDGVAETAARPRYSLPAAANLALQTYFSQRRREEVRDGFEITGESLLIENNCLACHARDPQPLGVLPKKFGDKLVQLAAQHEDLAPQIPALTPPSLNSVGDKLTDAALAGAITRTGPVHRPYLQVQMPKFRLPKPVVDKLAGYFSDLDRIPDYERTKQPEPTPAQLAARTLAGKRLVGTDGFSCTACHQVGSVQPVKAPPNARGPTLSMPQNRLRKAWFDRWVRNPARIVPRMEMPSVQTPVRGVLQDNLHEQLAAVWQVLSTPGFEPPLPEPVRTLRFFSSEDNSQKQPLVVTDLIEFEGQTLERAALIGLPNRQNVLFDFATHRLLAWSQGDLARQRTKGKNWYWEPAGSVLLMPGNAEPEFELELERDKYEVVANGQWIADPSSIRLIPNEVVFEYPLTFRKVGARDAAERRVTVQQTLATNGSGFERSFVVLGLPVNAKLRWRMVDTKQHKVKIENPEQYRKFNLLRLDVDSQTGIVPGSNVPNSHTYYDSGTLEVTRVDAPLKGSDRLRFGATYYSTLPSDEYHVPRPPANPFTQPPVTIATGFSGERTSLPTDIMPTALAWRPNGNLVIASLKGQVMEFAASSLNSPHAQGELLADGLAAPYGIQAGADYVDVVAKYGLVRLSRNPSGDSESRLIASGWGYTSDYHDWAVGLPRDEAGNYYVALPCFQDNRVEAAKRLRGSILKLVKQPATSGQPFNLEVLTHGHRFPMGLALNKAGELFVTDNQGNYNPFNELNHVQKGKHFGFVNKGEEKPKELTPPTIDIPHPWTRSVNGICFLNTPAKSTAKNIFGPLEGHLVGCEYDTRRLIRTSLQKVDGEYQGCAYPLTVPTPVEEAPLGPICCEVSPAGELFIGSIRDSGWGAANNIGEVIRVKVDPARFGHGLAEMRAIAGGFELDFFAPVEKELAEQLENYTLSSYRRESTPAYGGNDIDRRTEKIAKVTLSADRQRATLLLDQLRAGHVYELRLKSLAGEGEMFFPAEAHYTLRRLIDGPQR